MFGRYLEMKSLIKVRNYLNKKGYRTQQGKEFSTMALSIILRNRFYIGEVTHANVVTKGQHEAIINPITFGKVQALLKRNNQRRAG
ncbi:Recombinase [compost metagenome]